MSERQEAIKAIYQKISNRGFYDENDLIDIALLGWILDKAKSALAPTTRVEPDVVMEAHRNIVRAEKEEAKVESFNLGIEAAAQIVDECNREGPYNAIGAAERIRALRIVKV